MAYLDSRQRPDYRSMAAVVAVHGAVGAGLVLGLTITGVIQPPAVPVIGFDVKDPPPPPTPPPPQPEHSNEAPARRDIVAPLPPLPIPRQAPEMEVTSALPPLPLPPLPQPGTGDAIEPGQPTATPQPSFAPVDARPRNDPRQWVTDADYKGNWVRQEMTGKVRFRLEIAADGTVGRCIIIATSGHAALDQATCTLVSKRARFQPARGGEGEPVAGRYTGAIDWQLPD